MGIEFKKSDLESLIFEHFEADKLYHRESLVNRLMKKNNKFTRFIPRPKSRAFSGKFRKEAINEFVKYLEKLLSNETNAIIIADKYTLNGVEH